MDYAITSLMESLRVNIIEALLEYIKENVLYNNEQELNELYKEMERIAGNSIMTRQLNEKEVMQYMIKIADEIIQRWNKIRNKKPEIIEMPDENIIEIVKNKDKTLYVFLNAIQKTMLRKHKPETFDSDYIG